VDDKTWANKGFAVFAVACGTALVVAADLSFFEDCAVEIAGWKN
jgi:hypothetical protein